MNYQRSTAVFFSKMPDGQYAILDTARSVYFGLNPVAARIWELLEHPRSAAELKGLLLQQFDVSPEQCEAEVLRFLDQMESRQLIMSIANPSSPNAAAAP